MDFDGLMAQHAAATPFYKTGWFAGSTALAAVVIGIAAFVWWPSAQPDNNPQQAQTTAPADDGKSKPLAQAPDLPTAVRPPLPNVNVPFSSYTVDGESGGTIEHNTGSQLHIPEACFVDAEGNPVSGLVDIQYREFHDVADVFVSGIPMKYDSAGHSYLFETAGMIDIRGSQQGQPVFIAPGKGVDVEMHSETDDPSFNLYALNETTGAWTNIGKDEVRKVAVANEASESKRSTIAEDFNAIEERPTATLPLPDFNVGNGNGRIVLQPALEAKDTELKTLGDDCREVYTSVDEYIAANQPQEPAKANDANPRIKLDIDYDEFPEMEAYEGMEFEIPPTNNYSAEAGQELWESATIERVPNSKTQLSLTLTRGSESLNLSVLPVFAGKSYEAAMEVFAQQEKVYKERLAQRKEDERKAEEAYLARIEELKQEAEAALALWEAEVKRQRATASLQQRVIRSFEVRNFGIYNCDRPQAYPSGAAIAAHLEDGNGGTLPTHTLYHVEQGKQAVFTYQIFDGVVTNYTNRKKNRFLFNPKRENVAWCVTADAQLAIIRSADIRKLAENGKSAVAMELEITEAQPTTVAEVRELLAFN